MKGRKRTRDKSIETLKDRQRGAREERDKKEGNRRHKDEKEKKEGKGETE